MVLRYQRLIYTIPIRAGLDGETAAEVFQFVFTKLYQSLPTIDHTDRIRAWLVTTAKRETIRLVRQEAKVPVQVSTEEEEAQEALAEGDTGTALEKLQHAVVTDPANDDARFDYVKLLLQLGREDDAKVAFAPVIAKAAMSRKLSALKAWMDALDFVASGAYDAAAEAGFEAKIAANKRDFDTRYARARWLITQQRWTDAMDELLEILMRDKAWSEEIARKTYVAILELIEAPKPKVAEGQIPPEDPVVATYRRRLSSVVLS